MIKTGDIARLSEPFDYVYYQSRISVIMISPHNKPSKIFALYSGSKLQFLQKPP